MRKKRDSPVTIKLIDVLTENPRIESRDLISKVYGVSKGHKYFDAYRVRMNKLVQRTRDAGVPIRTVRERRGKILYLIAERVIYE